MIYMAPCSAGDLLDRITILRIKEYHTRSMGSKHRLVWDEMERLEECGRDLLNDDRLLVIYRDLWQVNADLWIIEDKVRAHVAADDYGNGYVSWAKQVPVKNDQRALLKRQINEITGSTIVEVKTHAGT